MNRWYVAVALTATSFSAASKAAELGFEQAWPQPFVFSPTVGATGVAQADGTVYVIGGTTLYALALADGAPTGSVTLDPARFAAITGVAAHGSLVAITATPAQDRSRTPGSLLLYDGAGLTALDERPVGIGPDMVTFTNDGSRLLVANEGEPECRTEGDTAALIDPPGSVTVLDLAGSAVAAVNTATFDRFNGRKQSLIDAGVRIYGPNASVAQDLEPEHIAVSAYDGRAWVTLQENNAIAQLDLWRDPPRFAAIRSAGGSPIVPLGVKDHGDPANALDVSDQNGVTIDSYPGLVGMYLPDGIDAGRIHGQTYLFTANEGDARDYPPCFSEEKRVSDLALDPAAFTAQEASTLSRLRVTATEGNVGGVYHRLYAFGGRSFAVWSARGKLVYDSGDTIERTLAERFPDHLYESRSDDKGPEPEELVLGRIAGKPYLFVGLERANGVMAFDVADPGHPGFAGFLAYPANASLPDGERPERLAFVPASANPKTAKPLLLVTNEVTRSVQAYTVSLTGS